MCISVRPGRALDDDPNGLCEEALRELYYSAVYYGVCLGVKTREVFLCFVAIVRVRVHYADFSVLFVLRHW